MDFKLGVYGICVSLAVQFMTTVWQLRHELIMQQLVSSDVEMGLRLTDDDSAMDLDSALNAAIALKITKMAS